jgi:hypothetical protein
MSSNAMPFTTFSANYFVLLLLFPLPSAPTLKSHTLPRHAWAPWKVFVFLVGWIKKIPFDENSILINAPLSD